MDVLRLTFARDEVTSERFDLVEAVTPATWTVPALKSLLTGLYSHDHGEAIWEMAAFDEAHFYDDRPAYAAGHGGTPYEAVAKVPVLVNRDVGNVSGRVSTVDVAPSVLDEVGLEAGTGTSDGSLFDGETTETPLVEASRHGFEKKAVYVDEYKMIASRRDECVAGFTLPEEKETQLPAPVETRMEERLPKWPSGRGHGSTVPWRVRARLEALGYE